MRTKAEIIKIIDDTIADIEESIINDDHTVSDLEIIKNWVEQQNGD